MGFDILSVNFIGKQIEGIKIVMLETGDGRGDVEYLLVINDYFGSLWFQTQLIFDQVTSQHN